MLYISILLLLFILSYHYDYKNAKSGRLEWYLMLLLIFILIAGLRYRLGVDSIRYEDGYRNLPTLSELSNYDFKTTKYAPGYIAFNAIARSISDEWVTMQFMQAIYVNSVIFWFFYKYSSKIFFCIIIYALSLYFNFMCEVMREACAVATLLLAWPYFVKRKWIHYYAFAIISVLFHYSGFVTLLLPILYLPIIRKIFMIGKHTIVVLTGTFIIGTLLGYSLSEYLSIFYFIDGIEKGVSTYSDGDLSGQVMNVLGIISCIILWILYPYLAIQYIINHKKIKSNNDVSDSFDFMIGISFIVAILTIPVAILYRYSNYFFPFAITAIGNWIYVKKPFKMLKYNFRYSTWLILFIPFFFLSTYGYFIIKNNGKIYEMARYYPYSSIIEKSTDKARIKVQNYHNAY